MIAASQRAASQANPIWSNAVSNERSEFVGVVLMLVLGPTVQSVMISVFIDIIQHDVMPNR